MDFWSGSRRPVWAALVWFFVLGTPVQAAMAWPYCIDDEGCALPVPVPCYVWECIKSSWWWPVGLCEATPACDDGDLCTADECDSVTGECSHPPVMCDDGDECTADLCIGAEGCIHVYPNVAGTG